MSKSFELLLIWILSALMTLGVWIGLVYVVVKMLRVMDVL